MFNTNTFLSAAAQRGTGLGMAQTHPGHRAEPDGGLVIGGRNIQGVGQRIGLDGVTQAGSFSDAMLQALDRVSDTQHFASALQREAIINPDAVDVHDITIAQAQANMSLSIAQNVLNRLTQGWRDLINTR